MAEILDTKSIGNVLHIVVDGDPSAGAGTVAPVGSLAAYDINNWMKRGAADTAWEKIICEGNSPVLEGAYMRLPIYSIDSTGRTLDDVIQQNSQNISLKIAVQAARTAAIEYTIPNPGNAITAADFVLTEGNQTINGDKTFSNNVIVNGNFTCNGTLSYLNTTNTEVKDALITLNKGGTAGTGADSGWEIEEGGAITGYFKVTSDRTGFIAKPCASAYSGTFSWSSLSADRVFTLPNSSGTFLLRPNATPGVAGQIGYFQDANNLISASGLTWDSVNSRLVAANVRVSSLTVAQPVKSNATGDLINGLISLTADISGVLPIANGGTNSSTALSNNRIMVSSSGSIVEHSALTQGSVLFANASGLPGQNNANFFWDITNSRLGLGTNAPSRLLDVNGTSIFHGAMRFNDATATNALFDISQYQVSTTDATWTTIATLAVPANGSLIIESRIIGLSSTGNSSGFKRTQRARNIAGTVLLRTPFESEFTSEDETGTNVQYVVSGTNVLVQVRGIAATNYSWTATLFVSTLS